MYRWFQLLRPSADHSCLVPVDETLVALAQVTDPLSVVTGVGTQRLGKSTLLNLFHSRVTAGFGLGHTLDAQDSDFPDNISSGFPGWKCYDFYITDHWALDMASSASSRSGEFNFNANVSTNLSEEAWPFCRILWSVSWIRRVKFNDQTE